MAFLLSLVMPTMFLALYAGWNPDAGIKFVLTALWISPLLAMIFGLIHLKNRKAFSAETGFSSAATAIGFLSFLFIVWAMLQPLGGRSHTTSNRVKCASNLRYIGQAMLMYANENKGHCPDRINDLIATQDITAEVFNCPSANETPASGPTTQATANNLTAGGHCSYVYLGKGVNFNTCSPDAVLAYEPLANHTNDGMNILFGDGHVEFIAASQAKKYLAEVNAGHNPPRPEEIR